jgi:hypothetical protein
MIRDRVGDPRQFASARLIELADGAERGVRALALSSGGGLDAWVMIDRSFDIGPLWHKGMPVAWQSPGGLRSPFLHDGEADGGQGFNRGFSGFLVTCGLEHIRAATPTSPQHGRLPFTPARLLAYGEDWEAGLLFAEGEVIQARYGGESLRLHRRIDMPIGGTSLRITDRVTNFAASPQAHAMLYHFNLGWPAIDSGSRVVCEGAELIAPVELGNPAAEPAWSCRPVTGGEWAGCDVLPARDGPAIRFRFDPRTLPFLQTWHDLRPRAGVLSIEPCTSQRGDSTLQFLRPDEARRYQLEVVFANGT